MKSRCGFYSKLRYYEEVVEEFVNPAILLVRRVVTEIQDHAHSCMHVNIIISVYLKLICMYMVCCLQDVIDTQLQ